MALVGRARGFLRGRPRALLLTFVIYLVTLFAFATLYYLLYKQSPRSFSFASDILKGQREEFRQAAEAALSSWSLQLKLLNHLIVELAQMSEPTHISTGLLPLGEAKTVFQTSNYKYTWIMRVYTGMGASPAVVLDLVVEDKESREVTRIRVPELWRSRPLTVAESKQLAQNLIKHISASVKETSRRLTTITGSAPEIWSFWDFLYFSAITQLTVGYGDILPNRTFVRLVVVLQLVIGLILLVVVVNIIAMDRSTK